MKKRKNTSNRNKQSNYLKLSIFQPNKYKFKRSCPLSAKGAPIIDYKNTKLLKKYISENGKILPSRITNISQKKQMELSINSKFTIIVGPKEYEQNNVVLRNMLNRTEKTVSIKDLLKNSSEYL